MVRVHGEREGDKGVQVVDVKGDIVVGDISSLGVDSTTGTQKRQGGIAQRLGQGGVGMRIKQRLSMSLIASIMGAPASGGNGATGTVGEDGRRLVLAAHVADFALELDQVDGLVAKDVIVDDQANFGWQFAQERALGLGGNGAGVWVDRGSSRGTVLVAVGHDDAVQVQVQVNGWRADLTVEDHLADGFLPATAGRVVVPDGVGVAKQPGIEMSHGGSFFSRV